MGVHCSSYLCLLFAYIYEKVIPQLPEGEFKVLMVDVETGLQTELVQEVLHRLWFDLLDRNLAPSIKDADRIIIEKNLTYAFFVSSNSLFVKS